MCGIWKKEPQEELTLREIAEFFKESNKFAWINLSGGEIFLREDLGEIINIILNACKGLYLLDFPTNGFQTELIVETVKGILEDHRLPRLLVTVSLDGPAHIHEKIRNIPGSWERAVETYTRLRKLSGKRFAVFFGTTLQPANLNTADEMLESLKPRLKDIGLDNFHFNLEHFSQHYYNNPPCQHPGDNLALWKELSRINARRRKFLGGPVEFLENRYQRLSERYLLDKKTPAPCQALAASFFLDAAGTVYPCSIYNRSIGNIADFQYNIYRLWRSDARRIAREDISRGRCPQCWTPCEAYQAMLARLLPKIR
jgi:MoaA/NifB/PqqE/SkfB family radical SAM enzyme